MASVLITGSHIKSSDSPFCSKCDTCLFLCQHTQVKEDVLSEENI